MLVEPASGRLRTLQARTPAPQNESCNVRLPQYREDVPRILCAHICLSARLFPRAWRTLLNAGTVEQVYESPVV